MSDDETLGELDMRIAAIRENLRELIEQAAAYSGAADEERAADRIADQEERLAALLKNAMCYSVNLAKCERSHVPI